MGFHEKSAWACLIGICGAYVPYFVAVSRAPLAGLALFWLSAAGLTALLTAFFVINAIASRSLFASGGVPPVDELDQRIERTAAKWAGFALAFAVMIWILGAMYLLPLTSGQVEPPPGNANAGASPSIPLSEAMQAVHWLFAGFVVANLVYYGGIVLGYRRMARA